MKHWLIYLVMVLGSLPAQAETHCDSWPLWNAFSRIHIQEDGRVIDYGAESVSTSEGQAYALFFSLIVGDKTRFDRILKWTSDNLAKGDMTRNLPGWKWGKSGDGAWKILDENAASDADIWMAYSLFQASARWKDTGYFDMGMSMLNNIRKQEVVNLTGTGSMLLPAPYGFAIDQTTWRLNPSYIPVQLMRYFAKVDRKGPWNEIARNTHKMLAAVSRNGLVPDWVIFRGKKGFYADSQKGRYTSYEAIRVYLWWALLNKADPLYKAMRPHVTGAAQFAPSNSYLPERIDVFNGDEEGSAPVGFETALAAYRHAVYGYQNSSRPQLQDSSGYYNYALSMFAYGWLDRRFDFNLDGSLFVGTQTCAQ